MAVIRPDTNRNVCFLISWANHSARLQKWSLSLFCYISPPLPLLLASPRSQQYCQHWRPEEGAYATLRLTHIPAGPETMVMSSHIQPLQPKVAFAGLSTLSSIAVTHSDEPRRTLLKFMKKANHSIRVAIKASFVSWHICLFVCVEVLRPSQPNGVMSSVVSLPNHTFTGQA